MSLETRIKAMLDALGPDIKALGSRIDSDQQAMLPSGVKQCNMDPCLIANAVTSLVSGRLSLVRCPVRKDQTITGISFFSVAQASAPLHQVFSLYNQNRTLIGTTANDTTTAWAANTRKRLVLTTPHTPAADGWLYVGIAVSATTVPTLGGVATAAQITGLAPIMHGTSNTGVSTPASHPATANALAALAGVPAVMLD